MLTLAVLVSTAISAQGAVQTKTITYEYDGAKLKGFLAWDDAQEGKRPGVLLVHEWWGLNDYAKDRAKQLAKMGYVAFAVDMYGEGKVTEHPKEAGQWATEIRKNQDHWVGRAKEGLKILKSNSMVDADQLAAIGYCFGGSTALKLAYSGADLDAVVSFHGALPVPSAEEAKNIKAKILICHGALDKFIPEETIQKVREAFEKAKVDYQLIYYSGAVHSFTVPSIGERKVPGLAYNPAADRRSWQQMRTLFHEVFNQKK